MYVHAATKSHSSESSERLFPVIRAASMKQRKEEKRNTRDHALQSRDIYIPCSICVCRRRRCPGKLCVPQTGVLDMHMTSRPDVSPCTCPCTCMYRCRSLLVQASKPYGDRRSRELNQHDGTKYLHHDQAIKDGVNNTLCSSHSHEPNCFV